MNMYKIKDHPNLSFKLINRVTGWVTFVIASMTYILTAESTASLWDCGEFITTSVGLQVGHPPGAPLFMIISRLFAIFAPSADTQAYMINCMSAICSGLTILFLFWSITHLARKLIVKEGEEMTMGQMFAILGASLIGSLTYTFTDTFWFSAVEGEVYAMSSLFTAVVFWAILKWENVAFERYANRWLILIAYLIGLSIGVHLLNLLAIPAIVFVYYFKKYTPTVRGFIKTGILSVFILGVVNFGIIPGVTDKNYITNSYHVHVTEKIDAFSKLKFESEFQKLSPGGAISYIEVPNMQTNIPAVLSVLQYIYENIMYAELNTKSDFCEVCGYDGEIKIIEDETGKLVWECPNCGNRDQDKLFVARRTCGYIGTQFWNQGRTQEIKDRVLHL